MWMGVQDKCFHIKMEGKKMNQVGTFLNESNREHGWRKQHGNE